MTKFSNTISILAFKKIIFFELTLNQFFNEIPMNIQSFLEEMKLMQDNLLECLDKQENDKKSLDDIKTFF